MPRPCPWSQGHARMLPALGPALGQGEMLGSPGTEPSLLWLHPILGGGHVGGGPRSGVWAMGLLQLRVLQGWILV